MEYARESVHGVMYLLNLSTAYIFTQDFSNHLGNKISKIQSYLKSLIASQIFNKFPRTQVWEPRPLIQCKGLNMILKFLVGSFTVFDPNH